MKDYYAILGVVLSAEDIVIKAAFKALAQRYHPDRNPGSDKATARMSEINEAYQVLSDPHKRKNYDQERGNKEGDFNDWTSEDDAEEKTASTDPFEKDWLVAIKYYPDLETINLRLIKTSRMLAFTYRATILETKAFDKRDEWAKHIETEFLKSYFGTNPSLIEFARYLISLGNKAAAKALNQAVRILGSSSADVIINKIYKEFSSTLAHDSNTEARIFGLTEDEVAYLGKAIKAVHYLHKYGFSEKQLARAGEVGRIRQVLCKGVLWVQDVRITKPVYRMGSWMT